MTTTPHHTTSKTDRTPSPSPSASDKSKSSPRGSTNSSIETVEHFHLCEENQYEWYTPESFYPVRIGDVFESRYKVLLKLGFGTVSTVWLCRDLREERYVTLKVFVHDHRQAANEHKVLAHIKSIETNHAGELFVRTALDAFEVSGSHGIHQCLVHEPLALPLSEIRVMCEGKLPLQLLKPFLHSLFVALDFLHTEASVVHTDIQAGNVMVGTRDESVWKDLEEGELEQPSACEIDGDRVIYASTRLEIPDDPGNFVLCDFGDAQICHKEYYGEVMPDLYRAPEIVLRMPWNKKIDIWNVGLLTWDVFEGKLLFIDNEPDRMASRWAHLARTISLLGPPPKEILERGRASDQFFDEDGQFKLNIPIPPTLLEEEEEYFEGDEKALFLDFLRKMLQWDPKDRATARQLAGDPWLRRGLKGM